MKIAARLPLSAGQDRERTTRMILAIFALTALAACSLGENYHPYSEDTRPLTSSVSN
jgi:hypothetical protein